MAQWSRLMVSLYQPAKPLFNLLRLITVSVLMLFSSLTFAHFNLDVNIRTIHVVHTTSGLAVYLRMPTPLFLAELANVSPQDDQITPAPFTYNRMENNVLLHFLDLPKLRKSPFEFAQIAVDGLIFEADGVALSPKIAAVRIHDALKQPPFASLAEAKAALKGNVFDYPNEEIYVGETVTDLFIQYESGKSVDSYSITSTYKPDLPGQDGTANLILDHFPGETRVFRLTGLLNTPVEIKNSQFAAAFTFVVQGIIHILKGIDHVFFVVCLTIASAHLVSLLWRVTGFTLGHTVTLIAGFWGFVPSGAWFISTVELGIALSIIYVALIALRGSGDQTDSHGSFFVTLVIGLLHGFGFSFVLHELLLPDGAHLWKSLLSFNIGVELGQVVIVLVVWTALLTVSRVKKDYLNITRWAVALPCIAVASFWMVQRGKLLFDSFTVG